MYVLNAVLGLKDQVDPQDGSILAPISFLFVLGETGRLFLKLAIKYKRSLHSCNKDMMFFLTHF